MHSLRFCRADSIGAIAVQMLLYHTRPLQCSLASAFSRWSTYVQRRKAKVIYLLPLQHPLPVTCDFCASSCEPAIFFVFLMQAFRVGMADKLHSARLIQCTFLAWRQRESKLGASDWHPNTACLQSCQDSSIPEPVSSCDMNMIMQV